MNGLLYLIPTTLGDTTIQAVIPQDVQQIVGSLRHFVVENIRSARRYLRKIDKAFPIDQSTFFELNKHTSTTDLQTYIAPIKRGENIGVISEAGCPAVADPGADIVAIAHQHTIRVVPLVGPSSILLALMGSGFSGQQFTFHGYLPKDRKMRLRAIKELETNTQQTGQTHIFMETPFRNNHLQEDLVHHLSETTTLCIASNLTLTHECIRTMTVKQWRTQQRDINKIPTLFLIGRNAIYQ